ncbi:hypothetical protein CR513_27268, partial [Mucuna pruriens]
MAKKLTTSFESFTLLHVPKDQNQCPTLKRGDLNRTIIRETISRPTIETANVCSVKYNASWKNPIIEVHERVCGTHIGGQALRFTDLHKAPLELFHSGVDILRPFPPALRQNTSPSGWKQSQYVKQKFTSVEHPQSNGHCKLVSRSTSLAFYNSSWCGRWCDGTRTIPLAMAPSFGWSAVGCPVTVYGKPLEGFELLNRARLSPLACRMSKRSVTSNLLVWLVVNWDTKIVAKLLKVWMVLGGRLANHYIATPLK